VAPRGRGLILIISDPEIYYEKHAVANVNLGTTSEFASRCCKKKQI
jgi:hypothetical protein